MKSLTSLIIAAALVTPSAAMARHPKPAHHKEKKGWIVVCPPNPMMKAPCVRYKP